MIVQLHVKGVNQNITKCRITKGSIIFFCSPSRFLARFVVHRIERWAQRWEVNLLCRWEVKPGKKYCGLLRQNWFRHLVQVCTLNEPLKNIPYKLNFDLSRLKPLWFQSYQLLFPRQRPGQLSRSFCLMRWKQIKATIKQMSQTKREVLTPNKLCRLSPFSLHMAEQLCRSLLLGIQLRSSFLHKWKQRALWFSWLAPLLVNRGDGGTRGNSVTGLTGHRHRELQGRVAAVAVSSAQCAVVNHSLIVNRDSRATDGDKSQEVWLVLSLEQSEEVVLFTAAWMGSGWVVTVVHFYRCRPQLVPLMVHTDNNHRIITRFSSSAWNWSNLFWSGREKRFFLSHSHPELWHLEGQ